MNDKKRWDQLPFGKQLAFMPHTLAPPSVDLLRGRRYACSGPPLVNTAPMEPCDNLITVDGDVSGDVIEMIKEFWGAKDDYEELGFRWKRGILLCGPPGTGKSATCRLVEDWFHKQDGISFLGTSIGSLMDRLPTLRV